MGMLSCRVDFIGGDCFFFFFCDEYWLTFTISQGLGQHMERSKPRPGWSATQLGTDELRTLTLEAIESSNSVRRRWLLWRFGRLSAIAVSRDVFVLCEKQGSFHGG